MEYEDINIDFINRTLDIINNYKDQYETTLLINCCIGLLVVPKEKHWKLIPIDEIPETGDLWGLSRNSIQFGTQKTDYSLAYAIRRMRNGVCHFRIDTCSDSTGNISYIKIKDINPRDKKDTFEVNLKVSLLKTFLTSLAQTIKQP